MTYLDLQAANIDTSAATTYQGLAPATGDTLTVRTLAGQDEAELIDFGFQGATATVGRVRSPYLHDDVQALAFPFLASDPSGLTGFQPLQRLRGQDTLIVEVLGPGAATEYVYWQLVYYGNLQAGPSIYIGYDELHSRAIEQVSNQVAVTTSATAGQWGSTLLSAGTGVLKANQTYAIIGYDLSAAVGAIGVYGPDTGNFRAGGPGLTTRQFTRNWFADLAFWTGRPCIPCFNSQNASGTNVQAMASGTSVATSVTLYLSRLK
jgi:hypothetical protein